MKKNKECRLDAATTGSNLKVVRSQSHEDNWRRKLPGRKNKLNYLLETNLFADVKFLVGNQEAGRGREVIYAHKFILVLYSSVFEALFKWSESTVSPAKFFNQDIQDLPTEHIPDIEPIAFKTLLKVISKLFPVCIP